MTNIPNFSANAYRRVDLVAQLNHSAAKVRTAKQHSPSQVRFSKRLTEKPGRLAAVIRTFLNYFLERDVERYGEAQSS